MDAALYNLYHICSVDRRTKLNFRKRLIFISLKVILILKCVYFFWTSCIDLCIQTNGYYLLFTDVRQHEAAIADMCHHKGEYIAHCALLFQSNVLSFNK